MSVAIAELHDLRTKALGVLDELAKERSAGYLAEARALVAAAGRRARAIQVSVDGRDIEIPDTVGDLIAARLHRSPVTVRQQIADARRLIELLPRTVGALADGSISPEHARVIVRTSDDLEPAALRVFEARVIDRAQRCTPAETGAWARRVRASVDRAGEEVRRQRARRHIDVRMWSEDDGLACLQARMPLADAARMFNALDQGARDIEVECDRSMGERRVAALADAVCGSTRGSAAPVAEVEIQVTVDLATLMHLSDDPAMVSTGHGPAEPITVDALRDVLADDAVPVAFRRLVLESTSGEVLDRGRTRYRPNSALRAFLVARDGTCRFPGCGRTARSCEIDHAIPWEEGGPTDRSNLGPLCVRHHLLKTHAGWSISGRGEDGSTTWRGPDGQTYQSRPCDLQPVRVMRATRTDERQHRRPPPGAGPPF